MPFTFQADCTKYRQEKENAMTPNQITTARVGAAFAAVALYTFFGAMFAADLAAVLLTVTAIALDGVDGYIARTRGLATPLGASSLLRAWHADGFSAQPRRAHRPQRLRVQLDAGDMVGTIARRITRQPRRVRNLEMPLFLLSRLAAPAAALVRRVARRFIAALASSRRTHSHHRYSNFLRRARHSCRLGRAPISR